MPIQMLQPSFRIDECLHGIRECLEKGWTGLGFKTVEFENAWRTYTELPHVYFLSSNTVGLHLALHILKTRLGWADDDEVITTPLTFVSTNHAILYSHLRPVFADIDDFLCLDPSSVAARSPQEPAPSCLSAWAETPRSTTRLWIYARREA